MQKEIQSENIVTGKKILKPTFSVCVILDLPSCWSCRHKRKDKIVSDKTTVDEEKKLKWIIWISGCSFSVLLSHLFAGQMKDTLWSRLRRFFPCFSIPAHAVDAPIYQTRSEINQIKGKVHTKMHTFLLPVELFTPLT